MNILSGLNGEQIKAVEHIDGPMLVLAGAGSGKTKVLTARIAYLLQQGVKPWQILAITFTNKAAEEMRKRVHKIVGDTANDIWLYTFHSFCARFLRVEISNLTNYNNKFVIYDTADCLNIIKDCLKNLNLDDKQYIPKNLLSTISAAKSDFIDSFSYQENAENFYAQKVGEIYKLYQERLSANNALDFDDLLMLTVKILQENKEIASRYQEKFRYVLIDEYQDTNRLQYLIAKILSSNTNNLFVVGDADQSIYAWRGADINNILDFEKDYPNASIIKLECNYRSTKNILDAANAVIENNLARKPKALWTENMTGEAITYYNAADERDEARFVIEKMQQLHNSGEKYGSMAVLYRANTQSRVFEELLVKSGIPYVMVGGLKFYERKEIKDVLAYLKVVFNILDDISLARIINVPRRGIGDATLTKIKTAITKQNVSMFEIIKNPQELAELPSRFSAKLQNLSTTIEQIRTLAQTMPLDELLERIMHDTGYIKELETEKNVQSQSRIDNLYELINVAKEFMKTNDGTLETFLHHISLVTDIDEAKQSDDAAVLMTLHSAKGLEFTTIFLVGLEEGLFPHSRSLMNDIELEEERRLCYVGITRAKGRLFLTNARMRMVYGNTIMYPPSRFLQEVPRQLLAVHKRQQAAFKPFEKVKKTVRTQSMLPTITLPQEDESKKEKFHLGDKVKHSKFGIGTIVTVSDNGNYQTLAIAFAGEGIKQLSTQYAPITKA